ncbi:MAG TPA: type I DNA topoisomerase [Vicinamibacterales bacterium]|nr:type I DNA topoisomerase [Vicinamibacterales bacterium]
MAKALVVVESPAKAKTINKYLGRDYKVVASMGHVRDLPKSKLGVDIENDFAEEYESLESRKKVLKELKDAAKDASDIYIATDPDREGEAIGWHISQELAGKKRKFHRLTFNEITKKAVQDALKHPRIIDEKMVSAQRARRVLDRLVGYKISPILWDKVRRGLSAGRVQSVALKLVCDREREIEQFVPVEYWHVLARLAKAPQGDTPEFEAKLLKKSGDNVTVANEEQSKAILADLERATWTVSSVITKERKRNAAPPFITSKLQQTARFPVKKTMMLAQQLYEGAIEIPGLTGGLITYMRTDSVRVADEALAAVRDHVTTAFGAAYLPESPNVYKSKADAQDAHEAIRPTSMQHDPETVKQYLTPDQYSLYRLIWNRFVASQMNPATFDETTVDITAGDYLFRVKGTVPKFAGWMATYGLTPGDTEEKSEKDQKDKGGDDDEDAVSGVLPPLAEGDRLDLKTLRPEQKFTQPPPRYSEATLVKELEENGIGRPSTYASIISVLQDREYAIKVEGRFKPTALGRIISDLLTKAFDDIIDVEYTRSLEDDLDKIEQGKVGYEKTLSAFYKKFKKDLSKAGKEMDDLKKGIDIGEACDKCGKPMLKRVGKFGPFIACSGYPDCTNTREVETQETEDAEDETIEPCENCGKEMVMKRGRFGQFLACSGYPECKTTRKLIATKQGGLRAAKPDQILDEKCPKCASNLVIKQGRFGEFTACTNYPECKYVKHKSTGVKCPKDADKGGEVVERKSRRGKIFFGCNNYPDCDFVLWNRPVPEACPKCGAPYLVEKTTKKHGRQILCNNEDCDYSRSEELPESAA